MTNLDQQFQLSVPVEGEPENLSPELLMIWRQAHQITISLKNEKEDLELEMRRVGEEFQTLTKKLLADQNRIRAEILDTVATESQLRRMMKFIVEQAKSEEDAELGRDLPI